MPVEPVPPLDWEVRIPLIKVVEPIISGQEIAVVPGVQVQGPVMYRL
ncbi:hypothetical protein [uncultured Croceitalea sp.]